MDSVTPTKHNFQSLVEVHMDFDAAKLNLVASFHRPWG